MVECDTCGRRFVHGAAAAQHMTAVVHWPYEFETCNFESCYEEEVQEHMDELAHRAPKFECETCSFTSHYEEDDQDHMDEHDHWAPTFECEACTSKFRTAQQARSHMDSSNHWRANWCKQCQRGFQNPNNLRMHLRGYAHNANSIACPICKKLHTTASGVLHHVETGSCPRAPQVNRENIYNVMNQRDTKGAVTNKQITWHSDENSEAIATAASWNGYEYQCGLCPKSFNSLRALNQHSSSPAHKQNIYHCLTRACGKQFKSLAALVNHMESESCGVAKFQDVQENFAGLTVGLRTLTF